MGTYRSNLRDSKTSVLPNVCVDRCCLPTLSEREHLQVGEPTNGGTFWLPLVDEDRALRLQSAVTSRSRLATQGQLAPNSIHVAF